jgi:hypothetical protein
MSTIRFAALQESRNRIALKIEEKEKIFVV